jgi:hypothetical protein
MLQMSESSPLAHAVGARSSREWSFLIACIGTQLAGQASSAASASRPAPDAAGLDWAAVIRLAETNRVVPLLAAAVLTNAVTSVAPDAVEDLRNRFRHSAQRGMFFVMELRNLLGALRKAKVRCIPLKGPVLTAGSYRKMGLRDFDDLDILVSPADVAQAVVVMAELGYGGWDIPQARTAAHLTTECEHQLICKERGVTVDLHWAIGRKYFTMPMDFEELWRDTVLTKLIGADVPDFSPEDNILFLCYHGGKHLFSRLSWVCDVAATIAAHPALEWDRLLARATEMGARRLLLLGLCLAQEVLGSELPAAIREAIASDSALHRLAAMVMRALVGGVGVVPAWKQQLADSLFHLRVRERMSDRLRYLFWAAAPNARDWNNSRLPHSLGFLLVLSRPVRLLRKSWRADAA